MRLIHPLAAFVTVALTVGCETTVPLSHAQNVEVARVDVLEGRDCGALANVVSMPDHCALSSDVRRSWMMSADVQLVAIVDVDGRARDVKVLKAPEGFSLEEATTACAKEGKYAPGFDARGKAVAGQTCPITLRLKRYASDTAQAAAPPCSPVQSYGPYLASFSAPDCLSR